MHLKPVYSRIYHGKISPRSEDVYAASGKKAKGGIISLFNDIVGEDEDAFANRTPDNPEILANNIRGDIKSLDERYDELAQVLGEKAYETPEEVLVYMQSQMPKAQQPQAPTPAPGQGGIASMAQQVPPVAPLKLLLKQVLLSLPEALSLLWLSLLSRHHKHPLLNNRFSEPWALVRWGGERSPSRSGRELY